jgi:putative oxidoreductase
MELRPANSTDPRRAHVWQYRGSDRSQPLALARTLVSLRLGAGIVFVAFGVGKFTDHASELASFRQYTLPAPDVFVYAIGAVEIVAGAALASRRLTRPAALVLAGDMVGAIVVSGIGRGEDISLTLAPVLLVAMIALLRYGPGGWARDRGARARRLARGGLR